MCSQRCGEITDGLLGQRRREDGGVWVFSFRVWTSTGRPGTNPGSASAFSPIVLFALILPRRVSRPWLGVGVGQMPQRVGAGVGIAFFIASVPPSSSPLCLSWCLPS